MPNCFIGLVGCDFRLSARLLWMSGLLVSRILPSLLRKTTVANEINASCPFEKGPPQMIDNLFAWKRIQTKQREAPLLKERERYLLALLNQGVCKGRVRSIASVLLHVIRLLELHQMRPVSRDEIGVSAGAKIDRMTPRERRDTAE
jgi:hypothetical protein